MKLGLALGGGGARGAAHIGVLQELKELGLWPDLITGTSAGGLVGALVAAGLSLEQVGDFIGSLSLSQLFTWPSSQPAITGNSKGEALLQAVLGRPTFADLPIPLAMVAVDLVSRKEVILDEGDLVSAVLATTAFPVLAPPVEREGLLLVDGGVLNNVPFDVARARGATHVIAVDLTNTAPYGTKAEQSVSRPGLIGRALTVTQRSAIWQVVSTVADIMTTQSVNARLAISRPDVLIRPDVGTIGLLDFHRWEEACQAGRAAVHALLPALEPIARERERLARQAVGRV